MRQNPVNLEDLNQIANERLDFNAKNYYQSGADGEQTLHENCNSFDRLRIRPRVLLGVSKVNTETKVCGQNIKIPICIAPSAMQKMAHSDGEIGVAKAVASFGTSMGVSTFSTTSYEDISAAAPNAVLLMQLYVYKDKELSKWLIQRAEKAGYKAILFTVDAPKLGQRIADVRHKFKLPDHLQLANLKGYDGHQISSENSSGLMEYVNKQIDPSINWDSIKWIQSITSLPIFLKGILTKEDAIESLKYDIQGIIVSNHGGRQLDGCPATIEALPEIVKAVNGKIDVYLDGGIRRGTDIFKALALGAKAVFIGRPALWGLAYNGEDGVKTVLQILKDELERAMILAGCSSLEDIKPCMVVHESYYWSNSKL
ncbi:uncharacterized protein LOC100211966 isoform X3 [Hydra vulgaris]|uniref:Uncharacterized protein LOC100211966 isoform X3 n=1 Tax=Hydra vulgaris TaxID=6087 RepID=A0ABM4CHV1_HYDVU